MTDMTKTDEVYEVLYSDALTLVAIGETRDETFSNLLGGWPDMEPDEIRDAMADALRDAMAQGVEREDIDPSWF